MVKKLTLKLTEKAFTEKIEKLQTLRQSRLKKVGNIWHKINGFRYNGDKQGVFNCT